jgi:uncharacterized protein (TIGR03435 family)
MSYRKLTVAWLLLAGAAFGQGPGARPEFEVETVRVNRSGNTGDRKGLLPSGQIDIRNVWLKEVIQFAYDLPEGRVFGLPGWVDSDRFDIVAKAPANSPEPTLKLMMQRLLEKEFKLASHPEQRPMDVFVLVVGKNGPKLQKAAGAGSPDCKRMVTPQIEAEAICTNMTMAELALRLPRLAPTYVDRVVIDETRLTGSYDLKLTWVGAGAVDQGGLTMFDAVDKMLGLKLEGQKRPVPVMVIDHVEKPADQ